MSYNIENTLANPRFSREEWRNYMLCDDGKFHLVGVNSETCTFTGKYDSKETPAITLSNPVTNLIYKGFSFPNEFEISKGDKVHENLIADEVLGRVNQEKDMLLVYCNLLSKKSGVVTPDKPLAKRYKAKFSGSHGGPGNAPIKITLNADTTGDIKYGNVSLETLKYDPEAETFTEDAFTEVLGLDIAFPTDKEGV